MAKFIELNCLNSQRKTSFNIDHIVSYTPLEISYKTDLMTHNKIYTVIEPYDEVKRLIEEKLK